jgi:hypothetical protein
MRVAFSSNYKCGESRDLLSMVFFDGHNRIRVHAEAETSASPAGGPPIIVKKLVSPTSRCFTEHGAQQRLEWNWPTAASSVRGLSKR